MTRTNIDLDTELIRRVMKRHGFETMREAVDAGLRELDLEPGGKEAMLALEGIGWDGDLDEIRRDRELPEWDVDPKRGAESDDPG